MHQVALFWALRAQLAEVVESTVLLDRWMYMHECGFATAAVPLFDPTISPRNVAFIAVRPL